jgi:hypothetical protein
LITTYQDCNCNNNSAVLAEGLKKKKKEKERRNNPMLSPAGSCNFCLIPLWSLLLAIIDTEKF